MRVRVGAPLDDSGDLGAEMPAGLPSGVGRLAVFDRVEEQSGDRLVLVRPVVERDRAGAEQVAQIRDARALANLGTVNLRGGSHRRNDPVAVLPGPRWKRPPALVDFISHLDRSPLP
jgi:hypothetical protein